MTTPSVSMPSRLIGHSASETVFLNLLHSGRMPHAFLITGQRGIGKCAMAFRMARALLQGDKTLTSLDFDDNDRLASQIHDLSHPDVRFLYQGYTSDGKENASGTIKIDDIRTAINFTAMTPSDSHHRVLILNDSHMIGINGQNALLKTLEEPGGHTTIILITHMPNAMLATIRSRCIHIPMTSLDISAVATILENRYPSLDSGQCMAYAHLGAGSVGDAVSYVENEALYVYQAFMDAVYKDADSVYTLAGLVVNKKNEAMFDIFVHVWQNFTSKVIRMHATRIPMTHIVDSESQAYIKITKKYTHQNLIDWVQRGTQMFQDTKAPVYLDKKIAILTTLLPLHT